MNKFLKNNKGKIIGLIVMLSMCVMFLKFGKENFKTLVSRKNKGTSYKGGATRDPNSHILAIERAHKCNAAGCATRETKQKKHILL